MAFLRLSRIRCKKASEVESCVAGCNNKKKHPKKPPVLPGGGSWKGITLGWTKMAM